MARKTTNFRTRTRLMAAAVSACFTASVYALPSNPTVVNGSASFAQASNVLNVTNSNGAIINWNTFSIGANETTRFIQTSSSSSVLNRVLADPSVILGTLTSNGRVFLINPNGIYVGQGARIDVAGFVASTLNLSDANFLANKLTFDATPNAGSVINQGSITTPSGGTVYLVAPNVSNEGIITTPQGETLLAAGQSVTLLDTATPGVSVEIVGAEGNATNLGTVVAEAGRIGIAGVLVKNSGTLNASSVVNEGGRIFLKASKDAYVDGSGRIVATGSKGGTVEVLGNRVAVTDNASIDASGSNGGGTVLVGGDVHGANPDVQNSSVTYFGANAAIKADATDKGNGGKVIVWADDTTHALGSISARGGANGGNGGFIETSGARTLDFTGLRADTRAPHGDTGTLLFDPGSLDITDSIWGGTYQGLTSNLILQTDNSGSGDISFTGSGAANTFGYNFSVLAYGNGTSTGNISFNSFKLSVNGNLTMVAGWNGASASSPATLAGRGNITLTADSGPTVIESTGTIAIRTIAIKAGGDFTATAGSVTGNDVLVGSQTGNAYVDIKVGGNVMLSGGVDSGSGAGQVLIGSAYGGSPDPSGHVLIDAGRDITANGNDGGVVIGISNKGNYGWDYVHLYAGDSSSGGNINLSGTTLVNAGSNCCDSVRLEAYYGSIADTGKINIGNGSTVFGPYANVIADRNVTVGGNVESLDGTYIEAGKHSGPGGSIHVTGTGYISADNFGSGYGVNMLAHAGSDGATTGSIQLDVGSQINGSGNAYGVSTFLIADRDIVANGYIGGHYGVSLYAGGNISVGDGINPDSGRIYSGDGAINLSSGTSAAPARNSDGYSVIDSKPSATGGDITINSGGYLHAYDWIGLYGFGVASGGGNITVNSGSTLYAEGYNHVSYSAIDLIASRNVTANGSVTTHNYGIFIAAGANPSSYPGSSSSTIWGAPSGLGGDVVIGDGNYSAEVRPSNLWSSSSFTEVHAHAGTGGQASYGGNITLAGYAGSYGYTVSLYADRNIDIAGTVGSYTGTHIEAGVGASNGIGGPGGSIHLYDSGRVWGTDYNGYSYRGVQMLAHAGTGPEHQISRNRNTVAR